MMSITKPQKTTKTLMGKARTSPAVIRNIRPRQKPSSEAFIMLKDLHLSNARAKLMIDSVFASYKRATQIQYRDVLYRFLEESGQWGKIDPDCRPEQLLDLMVDSIADKCGGLQLRALHGRTRQGIWTSGQLDKLWSMLEVIDGAMRRSFEAMGPKLRIAMRKIVAPTSSGARAYLTVEQLGTLRWYWITCSTRSRIYDSVMLALAFGLRQEQLEHLRRENFTIHPGKGRKEARIELTVPESKRCVTPGEPKMETHECIVELIGQVTTLLKRFLPKELVLPNWKEHEAREYFKTAARELKLDEELNWSGLHCCRHGAAYATYKRTGDLGKVQAVTGQRATETAKHYSRDKKKRIDDWTKKQAKAAESRARYLALRGKLYGKSKRW